MLKLTKNNIHFHDPKPFFPSSARSAFATLVSSAQQNTISTPTSTTAMLLSNLVNNSATSPTTTTSDPKTSLLEQMGLIKSQNVKPEFQPTPTTTTTTTAASLTNQVLNLLKAAQDSNNGVIFNSNSNQEISLSNSLNNLTNSLNGNLNGSTINSFNHGVNNSNFNRVSGISPKKSKIAQNGLFQNGSNEDSHNEENYSENLQNSILNSIKNVTQNNTHSNTQNNTNAKNNSQYNVLNNSMNNTLNNAQSHTLNTTDSTKSDASNLRLISHLPSLLAENLSNFDKQESQNPLSPNTISNNIIDQINAGSLNSTSNLSNGSLNGNSQNSIPKTKNISNLKRPLENSKNFDWKNQEKPVAIRNPGESIMYECRWCDHKSRRRNDLEDHERRHMEKMNFGCHLCPYRAKQKFTMKHHMYKVHQTKFDASKMLVFD